MEEDDEWEDNPEIRRNSKNSSGEWGGWELWEPTGSPIIERED